MAIVELLLSNPRRTSENKTLTIDVRKGSLGRRWVLALEELLMQGFHLKKDFCFMGFPNLPFDLSFWCQQLNACLSEISSYRKKGVWSAGYRIPECFSARDILKNGKYQPQPMFKIHHHFELLIGQEWSLSPYFVEANWRIRYLICQLNHICHQIEALGRSLEQHNRNPNGLSPFLNLAFHSSTKHYFTDADWKLFKVDRGGLGNVYLQYTQIGKNHWESFLEGDTEIFKSNVTGLRHFSGQFIMDCGPGMSVEDHRRQLKRFHQWLTLNGESSTNRKLALGRIQIGKARILPFCGSKNPDTFQKTLATFCNVQKVSVHRGKVTTEREFGGVFSKEMDQSQEIARFKYDVQRSTLINGMRGINQSKRRKVAATEPHLHHLS